MRIWPKVKLVVNETALEDPPTVKVKQFQRVTGNVKAASIRYDRFEGQQYMVVPMIMLTEGVHNGSAGPLYYPPEELAKTPEVWNHKPVVVYHPQGSACDPDILTNRKVGLIFNTHYKNGKLHAEAWLLESRLKQVDQRILDALENNTVVEVSTGLFTDNDHKAGVWNSEEYSAIARNYRPDHLAVLPDQKGACSVSDGAGLLRLNKESNPESVVAALENVFNDFQDISLNFFKEKITIMEKSEIVSKLIENGAWAESDKEFLTGLEADQLQKMVNVVNVETKVQKEGPESEIPAPAKALSVDEYISNAPAPVAEVLREAVKVQDQQKQEFINKIVENERNVFKPDYLSTLSVDELRGIVALATVPVQNEPNRPIYAGLGDVKSRTTESKTEVSILKTPKLTFDK